MTEALILEDDQATLNALATLVEIEGFDVKTAKSLREARVVLEHCRPQVVLSDLMLPDGRGIELLEEINDGSLTEFILITGEASVATAVEALRLGAYDYLTKPIDEARLKALLANVKRTRELKNEISSLRGELKSMGRFGKMVGTSRPMQELYNLVERVSPTDATVFLVGESGTGKELVAETVHQLSRRQKCPFVAVNCGAVSPTLIESELFGHERGSFTGADKARQGLFEHAHGGTLFLDEITEMPLELQVKLLRVLETGKLTRVGGNQAQAVDVRIISATNRDPYEAVEEGQLREDLLYRLRVFPVDLPPLRSRRGDIELLANHFLSEQNCEAETDKALTEKALEALRRYSWPGNVRELRNAIQRAYIVADVHLDLPSLPPEITSGTPRRQKGSLELSAGMSIAEAEKILIEVTLDAYDGDKRLAADVLGVSLKTLYNRLNTYTEQISAPPLD